jgi:hypothetical protein
MDTSKWTGAETREFYWSNDWKLYDTLHQCPKCFHWYRTEIETKTVWQKFTYGGVDVMLPEKVIRPKECPSCKNPKKSDKLAIQ